MNKLSVVIPVYNEEANIQKGVVSKIFSYLEAQSYDYEVLLTDDGSKDSTVKLLQEEIVGKSRFKIVRDAHTGKGFTMLKGTQEASGDIVLMMDFDQATPISELSKLLPYFNEGYDIVFGSRGGKRKNAPFTRNILSKGQVLLRSIILGLGSIQDTQCGFKAYKKDVIDNISKNLHIFNLDNAKELDRPAVLPGFDVEILFVARKLGYKYKEVPVVWDYQMSRRINFVKDAFYGVLELLYLRYLSLKGAYK